MRILVVSTVSYRADGISTVIRNLYANTTFENDTLTFVFPPHSDPQCCEELRCLGHEVIISKNRINHPILYTTFLKKTLMERKSEILHIHGNSGTCVIELIAGKTAGVPVRIMHGHSTACNYPILHRLLRPFVNLLLTDRFACSISAAQFLFGNKTSTIINNSFYVEKYRSNPHLRGLYRQQYGIDGKTVLGHVGIFSPVKNQAFLVDVFKYYHNQNNNSVLIMVGDGDERKSVHNKVDQLGLSDSVIFTGSKTNVNELLNMFDYFLFPSLTEGFGIAPVEAQANGLPVLAAKGRMPEAVQINDNFKFVALEDGAEKWCDELMHMDPCRCETATENVKKAGFDLNTQVVRLRQLYCDLLTKRKDRSCK